jgi:hypothetical protein
VKVEKIGINLVKPYWRNPRKSDKAVEAVKASIERYGFNSPIIVDSDMTIIAGHTRYRALRELGWKDVPVVVVDLPAEKAKEYRIADNRTSELAEWDRDLLIPELREIGNLDDFEVFFPDWDLGSMLEMQQVRFDPVVVTQGSVDSQQAKADAAMSDSSSSRLGNLMEVMCPCCGESFSIDPTSQNIKSE